MKTTVLPATSAGAIFQAGMQNGKFQGVMMATTPIVEFFATPPASWGLDLMEDQQVAGGLAWAYGELPTVLILVFIAHQWFRAVTRQARRADAEADLNGSPDLEAYNAYLEQLAAGTPPGPSR